MFSVLIRPFIVLYRFVARPAEAGSTISGARDRGLRLNWKRGENGQPSGNWHSS